MYNPTKPYTSDIGELVKSTWETPWVDVEAGTYAIIRRKFNYPEVDHTDGIGTKGVYHWQRRTFRAAVQDALAMNLNDLALMGATAYKLQNHIVIPDDDSEAILEIVEALTDECKKRQIAITGGETSIHSNADAMDLSITVGGFIKHIRENKFRLGEVLIGLPSSGIHSNGFSKVRELFGAEARDEFVLPTAIYLDKVLKVNERFQIGGMMHITGGAFSKLKPLLVGLDVVINHREVLAPQAIFREIFERGVGDEEMYTIFNCGIGFVLSCPMGQADLILDELGEGAVIGKVEAGSGRVVIDSAFSEVRVEL